MATMIDNRYTSVELKRLMLDLFNTMNTGYDGHGTSSTISKARDFLNNNAIPPDPLKIIHLTELGAR